jgi:hypothetical protein
MRIFETKTEEATGLCRKLLNDELNNLYSSYSSSNIIRVITQRMVTADMEGEEARIQNVFGNRRHYIEDLDANFRKITRDRP